jgi:hypothetical protein
VASLKMFSDDDQTPPLIPSLDDPAYFPEYVICFVQACGSFYVKLAVFFCVCALIFTVKYRGNVGI